MKNEPVLWTDGNGNYFHQEIGHYTIPLYTHPADESFDRTASHMAGEYVSYPAKTLTDEEILTAIKEFAGEVMPYKEYENTYSDGWLDACNEIYSAVFAILRKAQEK